MTEREKQDFNRADSQDDSGPPLKRLRGGFTEPLVKSGGIQHFNVSNVAVLCGSWCHLAMEEIWLLYFNYFNGVVTVCVLLLFLTLI